MSKGDETRAKIIRQAAELFNMKGYDGAAISDVMAATGLEKGGIYRHFDSKQELALAAFDYAVRLANSRYLEAIRSKRSAPDRLKAVVDKFAELEHEVPIQGGCPIMNTAIDSDDAHPSLRQRARGALERWHAMLAAVIERGVERGEVKTGTDPGATATRMIALMEGGLMMTRLTGEGRYLDDALHAIYGWIDHLALTASAGTG